MGVANITLAVTQLPSVEGTFALLVDILLSLGIWRVWQVVRGESVGRDQVSLQLTIGALLLLVSSLIHLFVGMGGHQIIVVVVVLLCLPFCVAGLQSLLMILIGSVVLWAFVSSIVASPVETAITTIAAIVACAIALANWNWLRTLQSRAEEAIDEDLRTNHGALNRRQLQARDREREQIAVEASCNGYWYWDLEAEKIQFSNSWAEMLGYRVDELGTDREAWFSRVHPHYLPELKDALSAHLYGKTDGFQSQYRVQHRDGTYLWVMNRGIALRGAEGSPIAVAGSQIDITQLVDVEKSIADAAYRDRLTGLPNREAFLIRLDQAVSHLKKRELRCLVVMFLDVDRFKVVNDSLGHLVGDQLLAAVSTRLKNCTRQTSGDLIARFGGDEFVVLIEDFEAEPSARQAREVAERMIQAMDSPFRAGKHEIRAGVSIGIALWDSGVNRADDLLRNADTAMYHAKAAGRGRIVFFNSNMHEAAKRLNQLQNDLAKVIERDELVLHYQPIVSVQTGTIVGAEALIRWRHSNGEMIGPSEFIPIAEETGLIESIGEWVLQTAFRQSVEWQRAGLASLKISINVSPQQLRDETFSALVQELLAESALDPGFIEFELTETALMGDIELVARTIEQLVAIGVGIALDDFGTGYSSLEHLRNFTFRTLKIDRSFVAALTTDAQAAAVARGLINLAHELQLTVTGEGVETGPQLSFLRAHDCDRIQGYYASRPLDPLAFANLLQSGFNLYGSIPPESLLVEEPLPQPLIH